MKLSKSLTVLFSALLVVLLFSTTPVTVFATSNADFNLKVSKTDQTSVLLTWSLVPGSDRYCVYRSTNSKCDFKIYATTSNRNYTDHSVQSGNTYYYYVTSYAPRGVNGPKPIKHISNVVSAEAAF
jgi:fibronectin type 3 domain-containing protein